MFFFYCVTKWWNLDSVSTDTQNQMTQKWIGHESGSDQDIPNRDFPEVQSHSWWRTPGASSYVWWGEPYPVLPAVLVSLKVDGAHAFVIVVVVQTLLRGITLLKEKHWWSENRTEYYGNVPPQSQQQLHTNMNITDTVSFSWQRLPVCISTGQNS